MYVCLSVCPHKPFVHDSDHNFCSIFVKFGTWVNKCENEDLVRWASSEGQWPPFYTLKPPFGENLQLKPEDSSSAYFFKTDKAIITKLDQNIKQIELYTNCKIRGQKGAWPRSRDLHLNVGTPSISLERL